MSASLVGSEMCIRDSSTIPALALRGGRLRWLAGDPIGGVLRRSRVAAAACGTARALSLIHI
eukprot:11732778-Alexandrium_andersonii.AAC.1